MVAKRVFRQIAWCLLLPVLSIVVSATAESAEAKKGSAEVTIRLKIRDSDSTFRLEATKAMSKGVSGLDAVRQIVKVEYKEYRGLGAFVTSFCGVKPKKGHIWALYLDGKRSNKGISNVKFGEDTLVEWKTEKP